MIQVKDMSKDVTRQSIGGFGALVPDVAREVGEARPAKPLADWALIAGFVAVLGAIFWSALFYAVDLETFAELVVLFALVASMFPADAVWRLVG